ncbi:MAG: hypothetical protein HS122_07285 [Opitutaceae bacterium]|nr:hypothetical protein [Opitutaceae bacterium]
MKFFKLLLPIVAAGAVALSAYAADSGKPAGAAAKGKKAKCCVTAVKKGETCTHACCVEAAKEGKNCEKCGGKNPS